MKLQLIEGGKADYLKTVRPHDHHHDHYVRHDILTMGTPSGMIMAIIMLFSTMITFTTMITMITLISQVGWSPEPNNPQTVAPPQSTAATTTTTLATVTVSCHCLCHYRCHVTVCKLSLSLPLVISDHQIPKDVLELGPVDT